MRTKFYLVAFVLACIVVGSQAHANRLSPVNTVLGHLLKTTAGQQYLSRMTGKNVGQMIKTMGLTETANALEEASKGNKQLAQQLSRASAKMSASQDPQALAKELLATIRANRLQPPPPEGDMGVLSAIQGKEALNKIRRGGVTARLGQAFKGRSDVRSRVADQIVKAGMNVKSQTGKDLYGADVVSCVSTFEASLVSNLGGIVRGLSGAAKIKGSDHVFKSLVSGARETFELNRAQAREKVCGLAGYGAECSVFSKATFGAQCAI